MRGGRGVRYGTYGRNTPLDPPSRGDFSDLTGEGAGPTPERTRPRAAVPKTCIRALGVVPVMLLLFVVLAWPGVALEAGSVPILYTTDLYHPHDDPDDHYDLLTLFALPEFDIRGIVIDMGERGQGRAGVEALLQVMHLTGRTAPYAVGLAGNLESPEDTAEAQHTSGQGGVDLILKVLRETEKPVTVFVTGSLRDVAAAFNREPALVREKVGRLYVNAGWVGEKEEWNVKLDRHAFVRVVRSDLPVYWAPCFGDDGYQTYWKFRQQEVFAVVSPRVQNVLLYMLTKQDARDADPIAWLDGVPEEGELARLGAQDRNMWCTAVFLDAAARPVPGGGFIPLSVTVGEDGRTLPSAAPGAIRMLTFRQEDSAAYGVAMRDALCALLAGMDRLPGNP